MLVAWRITKQRHDPWDPSGARLHGARWNARGHAVLYASDSFAGALLEILAHAARPRTLPGAHHAVRIELPESVVEVVEAGRIAGWEERESEAARAFGTRWLEERRSVALAVPALPSRPVGRTILINPAHPASAHLAVSAPFAVPWDERLFG